MIQVALTEAEASFLFDAVVEAALSFGAEECAGLATSVAGKLREANTMKESSGG